MPTDCDKCKYCMNGGLEKLCDQCREDHQTVYKQMIEKYGKDCDIYICGKGDENECNKEG